MKRLLKAPVAGFLAILARAILRKYQPQVVMVTGSVGKTSTKDAVASALAPHFHLRASEKSYNSEFGVPLTVIGAKNPWENPAAWFGVFQEALALIMLPSHYPKLLVLEVGADRPGDLAKILSIVIPDAVVVTKLPEVPVHVEAYASPQAVRDEEFAPAYALPAGKPLILCADDVHAKTMATKLEANIMTYGFSDGADVRLGDPVFTDNGMSAPVTAQGSSHELKAPHALGRAQLYAPAAALATALALGVSMKGALRGLSTYSPPPGRARLHKGKNESLLIDDSYNASPAAVEEALNALSLIPGTTRRIAALGDMLELGRYSREEHERIGTLAAQKVDMLIAVGPRARAIQQAARAAGFSEDQALAFDTSREAAHALVEIVEKGDVVLVKGSQSVRMERIVERLLENPSDTAELVRQEREWKQR